MKAAVRAAAVLRPFARTFATRSTGLVTVERDAEHAGIAVVTLNAPERLNALTVEMGEEFVSTVEDLTHAGRDLRAVVLRGAGRAFSAGGDVKFLRSRIDVGAPQTPESQLANKESMLAFYDRFLSIKKVHVPVVAAINGPAVGAGLCLAMAADLRIVSETAKLSLNFVQLGIHPGMAASFHLPRLVGPQHAARLMLTGDMIKGPEAVAMGMCLKSVPEAEVLPEALALARRIAKSGALPVNQTVETLRSGMATQQDACDRESSCQATDFGIFGEHIGAQLDKIGSKKK